ncbi:hypothetical protein ACQKQD_07985 [Methylobacterium sp. NPDC080182]|uniref:hypothetical protein n=1 Tax=Methylobacterium sp. NPDC080182 TaxID=3390590 RepID=UPI003D021607
MASKPRQNHSKPTSSNLWDRPPVLPTGDASQDDIYRAVGHALSRWEYLETELAALFALLCDTTSIAPQLAYGSAMAFGARRDMLVAASQAYFASMPFDRVLFDRIIEEIGKLSGLRNDIAHGTVMVFSGAYGSGFYLGPPPYNFSKNKHLTGAGHKYQYTSAQIVDIKNVFNIYHAQVKMLRDTLEAERQSWRETRPEPLSELEDQECPQDATLQSPELQPQASDPSPQSGGQS